MLSKRFSLLCVVLSALAPLDREAGDPAVARDLFATLLPIHERVLGAEHPTPWLTGTRSPTGKRWRGSEQGVK
jgi:hypothetical protein